MGKESRNSPPKPPQVMTKRQLSRHEKEQRLQRIAYAACAVVIVVAAAFLGYGFWQVGHMGEEAAVTVGGKAITKETYAKVMGFRMAEIDIALANYQNMLNSASADPQAEEGMDFLSQLAAQQIEQLQFQKMYVESNAIEHLASTELIRQEAAQRGITVTEEDVDNNILTRFGSMPAETTPDDNTGDVEGAPADGTATTEGTPTPEAAATTEPTKTPLEQAKGTLAQVLGSLNFMSEDEYRTLVAEPEILSAKLRDAIGQEVPTSAEQVQVRHILVGTEEEAKDAMTKLQEGADFATLAQELSTDQGSKEQGGDLGWFPRGVMVTEFEEAAFKVQPGQLYPEIVQSVHGYHIIKGEGHEDNRAISEDLLTTLKDKAFTDWLQQQRDNTEIVYDFGEDTVEWARKYISNAIQSAAAE